MKFHRISDAADPLFEQLWPLYEGSFPPEERRSKEDQRAILADPSFYSLAVLPSAGDPVREGEEGAIALFCFWIFPDICYLEHLAVMPGYRSAGIGGKILTLWKEEYDDPDKLTVLEIEAPVSELCRRRQGFYERHGFVFNHGERGLFMHPSYDAVPHYYPLCLMSLRRAITEEERHVFDDAVLRRVLKFSGPAYDGPLQLF